MHLTLALIAMGTLVISTMIPLSNDQVEGGTSFVMSCCRIDGKTVNVPSILEMEMEKILQVSIPATKSTSPSTSTSVPAPATMEISTSTLTVIEFEKRRRGGSKGGSSGGFGSGSGASNSSTPPIFSLSFTSLLTP